MVHGLVRCFQLLLVLLNLEVSVLLHAEHLLYKQVGLVHGFHLFSLHVLSLLEFCFQTDVSFFEHLLLREVALREHEGIVLPLVVVLLGGVVVFVV